MQFKKLDEDGKSRPRSNIRYYYRYKNLVFVWVLYRNMYYYNIFNNTDGPPWYTKESILENGTDICFRDKSKLFKHALLNLIKQIRLRDLK